MRILAIRGRNLASLAGGFEIDFRREPLASAGLFAICGRTGSGKSTLLDALCLALYDNTPRLARAGARGVALPDAGDGRLGPSDPRTLLRRGTPEGYAEVDFGGSDGVEYRARWSVRRARGRVDGRLQATELSLVRTGDNQPVAAGKTEVLAAIRDRVGLDFAQFTRAVLLAQNEFNAFLNADDNQRAELLELLTGTGTYTLISQRAFERAKIERQALDLLKAQATLDQPLDAEARATLENAVTSAAAALAAREEEATQLDGHLRWHDDLERARAGERLAQNGCGAAARDRDEADSRFRQLALVEAAQPAAPRLLDYTRAAEALRTAREDILPARERQAGETGAALRVAEATFEDAAVAMAAAEAAEREAAPALGAARLLDAQIEDIEGQHRDAVRQLAEVETACDRARRRRDQARAARDTCAAQREQDREWLEAHEGRARLATEWPRWDTLFNQAARGERDAAAGRVALAGVEEKLAGARVRLGVAGTERETAESGRAAAEIRFEEADRALAAFDFLALGAERQQAQARQDTLSAGQVLDERLRASRTREAELAEDARREGKRAAGADTRVREIEAAQVGALVALRQAERAYDEVRLAAAADVRTLRTRLKAGRPCPVCGGTEHPYLAAGYEAPDESVLAVVRRQVDECRQVVEAFARERTEQQTIAGQARARGELVERELEAVRDRRAEAERAWQAHPTVAETAALPDDDRPAWFTEAMANAQRRDRQVSAREAEGHRATQAREQARKRVDEARETSRAAERAETEARAAVDRLDAEAEAARAAVARVEADRDKVLDDLDVVLSPEPGWREAWRADPERFHGEHRKQVEEYRVRRDGHSARGERLGKADVELAGLEEAAERAAASLAHADDVFRRLDDDLGARRAARSALFGGRPAADQEAELRGAVRRARDTRERAETSVTTAKTGHVAAISQLDDARRLLAEREQAAAAAQAALDDWLLRFNAGRLPEPSFDVPALAALLTHDAAWMTAERAALQKLEHAVRHAQSVLSERAARRQQIEELRSTDETADVLRTRRAGLTEALEAARAERVELGARLRQDDARRQRTSQLGADLARRESVAALWARMSELVGSADGRKFRNYAQQLTLDVLLACANRHLADLARRYALQRLPDTLALIVVDHDMADEVRSSHSLSGGESFLVSLALALGLASLSANRVRVESLFIDEGFGALDAEILGVAMDALDRLQGQGRKVGVISHVEELAERIGTRILVEKQSGGRSRVGVVGATS